MSDELPRYPSYAQVLPAPTSSSTDARVEPGSLDAGFATVSTSFAPSLTTHHSRWFEVEVEGQDELTRDIPNVGEEALQILDERGLAQPGQSVVPGALLIGRVSPREGAPLTPEEKLLRAIFGEKAGDVVDRSVRAPPGCFGEVTGAELEGKTARVQISWTRPLEVGDVLDLDGHLAVVAAIQPQSTDVACKGVTARAQVKKHALARDLMHARCIGPYELLTQLPLEEKEHNGGQRVGAELAAVLAPHAPWLVWEFFTLKSDAVSGRTRAFESLVKQENPGKDALDSSPVGAPMAAPSGGMNDIFSFFERPKGGVEQPESVARVGAWLLALAIEVDFTAPALGVTALTIEALGKLSFGRVEEGGLFSQKLFGPEKDYECECGKYKRMKHRGTVCETCGVEVIQSKVRRERFGHIELVKTCLHPLLGTPIDQIPVLPAGLRPSASPLNALYERVLEARTPSEQQGAVDALFTALAPMVDETWRTSVFSKPVDYSGVAHLTVDPSLPSGTCRLPRELLTELFKPFVYGLLEAKGFVTTIKSAKKMVERGSPEAMKGVEAASAGYPLLLVCGTNVVSRTAVPWDFPAIAVDAQTAQKLGGREVRVHVPVTTQGVLEAKRLPALPAASAAVSQGWLSDAMRGGSFMSAALRAAKSAETATVDDAVLSCALGRAPAPPPLAELEAWEQERSRAINAAQLTVERPAEEQQVPQLSDRSLDELEFSVRLANQLQNANLRTVRDLCERTEAELLKMDGFGRKQLKEVKEILAELGLSLGMRF